MKLKSLRLKGLTVFKEPVEIDFNGLPAGLIAIVGPNGAGKTSLLEAFFAALYRELPSRGNLYRYCSGKDAYLDMSLDTDGSTYRSRVLINAQSEDMKGFLEKDGTVLDDCRQGKLAPFDKAVERLIGSRRLLLSSAFSAQNRKGNFADLGVAERKNLFIELLNLGQFPGYERQIKDLASSASADLVRMQTQRDLHIQDAEGLVSLEQQLTGHKQAESLTTDRLTAAEVSILKLTQYERDLAKEVAQLEAVTGERVAKLANRITDLSKEAMDLGTRITRREVELKGIEDQRRAKVEHLQKTVADLEKRIANNEALMGRATEIRAAVVLLAQHEARASQLEQEYVDAVAEERKQDHATATRQRLEAEKKGLTHQIAMVESAVEELKDVPCQATGIYANCIKITNAVKARAGLPALKEQAREFDTRIAQAQMAASQNGHRSSVVLMSEVTNARIGRDAVAETAKLVAALDSTEERLTERRAALADAKTQLEAVSAAPAPDGLLAELKNRLISVTSQYGKASEEQAALQRGGLEYAMRKKELAEATTNLDRETLQKKGLEQERERIRRLIQQVSEFRDRAIVAQRAVDELEPKIRETEQCFADWNLLTKAVGKDGVPALEIDAAGPAVSALVNGLLSSCFSSRFTVDLRTQKTSADGKKLLEDFSIRVLDGERGRDGTLDDLSGGEKVLVGEALGMALSVYNKGSHPLLTGFRDETTGALDSDNATKYVLMLRRALALGGFHRIIFITHSPECAELADARLRCGEGKVSIEL